jgi:aspartyl protease family protein
LILAVLLTVAPGAVGAAEQGRDLGSQLRGLAEEHEFTIVGLDKIAEEAGKTVSGDLADQLKDLLRDYNYVILRNDTGHIDKVLLSSRIRPAAEIVSGYRVPMTRRGEHHVVKAVLVGPSGARRSASLIIDTGASAVVLPLSMSKRLGFREDELHDGWSQTANGKVRTKRGVLASLQVGQTIAEEVKVSFVADEALSSNSLLGMSFLGRFRVTIDDANKRLILISK